MIVERIPSTDPRCGRHQVHDPRSRSFARISTVDTSKWHSHSIRIFDPRPNPNQPNGCCTGCAETMLFNTAGNRKPGVVLGLNDAEAIYSHATQIDDFPGSYPPDDTGSSGLYAAKAAVLLGYGGTYSWIFNGADGVVEAIMEGHTVAVGTKWYRDMFTQDSKGRITPTGSLAGGHEYVYRGYDAYTDELIGRCWWGDFRDFRIKREQANDLLMDGGDAHVQERIA